MKMIALFFLFFSMSFPLFSREEIIITPETSLIDIPTAGIIDYSNFELKTRFYNNGGILTYMNIGVINNILNLGASFMIDKIIGSQTPVRMVEPKMQIKFRFCDGGYYIPALVLGYDGQGYYYDSRIKKFMQKGKGLYLVGSKEILVGLMGHMGFNIPDFDDGYLFGFIGVNYNVEDKINIRVEYDNLFHSDYNSRFNFGVGVNITPNFIVDVALRDVGRNSSFSNGWPEKTERIVQFKTFFYLGD
ncbi:MAG: hypothetical protein ACP5IO_04405 [Elusimicrobiales bacterium]